MSEGTQVPLRSGSAQCASPCGDRNLSCCRSQLDLHSGPRSRIPPASCSSARSPRREFNGWEGADVWLAPAFPRRRRNPRRAREDERCRLVWRRHGRGRVLVGRLRRGGRRFSVSGRGMRVSSAGSLPVVAAMCPGGSIWAIGGAPRHVAAGDEWTDQGIFRRSIGITGGGSHSVVVGR